MKHEKCQQYVGRMYVKVAHDVQGQTILKVKFLVFIGLSFYQCNDNSYFIAYSPSWKPVFYRLLCPLLLF